MKKIDMPATAQYWLRILGALALIKAASSLVKSAEKLISSTIKAQHPEIVDAMESPAIVEYEEDEGEPVESMNGTGAIDPRAFPPAMPTGDEVGFDASEN